MINEALDAYANTAYRKFKYDRSQTVGGSEIGMCVRRIHMQKHNAPRDEDHIESWGATLRGTTMEDRLWVPAMKKRFGKNFLYGGKSQKRLTDKYLSATPDGLVTNLKRDVLKHLGVKDIKTNCILAECKTIDPRVNLQRVKEENAYQVQVQMGLIRAKTQYKPHFAVISYIDASFWNEVMEFAIEFDPDVYAAAHERAKKIFTTKDAKDLPPEGWIAGGRECQYCPFVGQCGDYRRSVPEGDATADPQFVAEVVDTVREIDNIDVSIDQLSAKQRTLENELKDRLREKGIRRIPGVVTWSAVKGRKSYAYKDLVQAAIAAGVDVEQYSTVGEPTDRLQISSIPGEIVPRLRVENADS